MVSHRSFIQLFLILILCLSTSCKEEKSVIHIAVIPKGNTQSFWKQVEKGARQAEKELGVEIWWEGPEIESDRKKQIQLMQSFIGQGADAIVLAPLDSRSLTPSVDAANKRGIPVVIIDSELLVDHYRSFVGTDNYQAGRSCAQRMIEALEGKGNLLLLRNLESSSSTSQREAGFLEGIAELAPDMKVVSTDQYAQASLEEGFEVSRRMVSRFSQVDGIFCPNETTTEAMLQALQAEGRDTSMVFIGFDANQRLLEALQAGQIDALALQDPIKMGYMGVKTALSAIRGEAVPKRISTDIIFATPDNLDSPEIQNLLQEE
jgi:ribose transport system substrate-binding protein